MGYLSALQKKKKRVPYIKKKENLIPDHSRKKNLSLSFLNPISKKDLRPSSV